jgi:HSP20 family protein
VDGTDPLNCRLRVAGPAEGGDGEDEQPFIRERAMGSFTRRVYLSDHLDAGAIEAAYNNGVLAVRIPVVEKAKPRKIEIQRAAGNGTLNDAGSTHAINS